MRWQMDIYGENPDFDFKLGFDMDLVGSGFDSDALLFRHGQAIPLTLQPLHFNQRRPNSNYPDLLQGRFIGNMIFSARMRAVIESVAPPTAGLQFIPAVIHRPDQRPGPADRFYFNVMDLVDSIIPEKSQVARQETLGELYAYSSAINATFTFRDEVVADRHIWVDKYSDTDVFISDEMRAAMMAAGLTGVETRAVDPK